MFLILSGIFLLLIRNFITLSLLPIQKLYYSAGYEPICIHCGQEVTEDTDPTSKSYPQCGDCKDKAPITKI